MPKLRDRKLSPFQCTTCGKTVAWTAPGEAKRIAIRAAVYCDDCKDAPATLTPRQAEVVEVAAALRNATGHAPTMGEIGDAMRPPLSRSRVQSLAASIRLRGHDQDLQDALYGEIKSHAATTPVPEHVAPVVHTPPAISDEIADLSPLDALEQAAAHTWEDVRY